MTTLQTQPFRLLVLESPDAARGPMTGGWSRVSPAIECVQAATREQFLDCLETNPHAILASFRPGPFSTLEALRLAREKRGEIPFIVWASAAGGIAAAECLQAGALEFIEGEPADRLEAALRRAMEICRRRDASSQAQEDLLRYIGDLERRLGERTAELMEARRLLGERAGERQAGDEQTRPAGIDAGKAPASIDGAGLAAVLDELSIGAAILDADGLLEFLSQKACRTFRRNPSFNLAPSQMIGRRWQEVFPLQEEDLRSIERLCASSGGERSKATVRIEGLPGERRHWLDIEARANPNDPGRKFLFLHDATEVHELRHLLQLSTGIGELVGKSLPMDNVFRQIRQLAEVDSTVLIEGETGTGKELVARAIHLCGPRKDKPFVAVNCAGLTETLVASQLFGHRRGSFTGAFKDQVGLFEAADGGTIFLDEIGDIPMSVQANLLRVLQEKQIVRLGETQPRRINVRVLAATHHQLHADAESGKFRRDLLYRIRVARIHLPPLRERRDDIPLLASAFLSEFCAAFGKTINSLSREALSLLPEHSWPGNVRELKNAIEFAAIRCQGEEIQAQDLPPELMARSFPQAASSPPVGEIVDPVISVRIRVLDALHKAQGNRTEAARLLGVSRATFYRRLTQLDIGPLP